MGKVDLSYLLPKDSPGSHTDDSTSSPLPAPAPIPIRIVNERPFTPTGGNNGKDEKGDKKSTPGIVCPKGADEFYPAWERFLAVETGRKGISKAAKGVERATEVVNESGRQAPHSQEYVAQSYEAAARTCKAEVAAIVKECRQINQKYTDTAFNLDTDHYCIVSLDGEVPPSFSTHGYPHWAKRVEDIYDDPKFILDKPGANDIQQGHLGNCWFIAGLMAVCAKGELIEKLCVARDEQVGIYGFVFFRDDEWIYEIVDDKLYLTVGDDDEMVLLRENHPRMSNRTLQKIKCDEEKIKLSLQRNGKALYFARSKANETWLPLLEKAYAKAHGDYTALEGGIPSEAMEGLTGGVSTVIFSSDVLDRNQFWEDQLMQVNKRYLFTGAAEGADAKGVVGDHGYAVVEACELNGLRLLKMRDPWGECAWEGEWRDGSSLWTAEMISKLKHTFGDRGIFWMTYEDFLKHFRRVHRIRLFDDQWSVASRWTSINATWTPDYCNKDFRFTATQSGPVVIALSRTDTRYFSDLAGRFKYTLRFIVCKADAGESQWISRSAHFSNVNNWYRSVSVEIEHLEAGDYKVRFEVTARLASTSTATESIERAAQDRQKKLLSVGRKMDYAMSKGNLRALEIDNLKRRARETVAWQKAEAKRERKFRQAVRQRWRKRRNRYDTAMLAEVEAYELKRWWADRKRAEECSDGSRPDGSHRQGSRDSGINASYDQRSSTVRQNSGSFSHLPHIAESSKRVVTEELQEESTRPGPEPHDTGVESESPHLRPLTKTDDDFDWDSDMDGPFWLDDDDDDAGFERFEEELDPRSAASARDPWHPTCVVGLRVYSKDAALKIDVAEAMMP